MNLNRNCSHEGGGVPLTAEAKVHNLLEGGWNDGSAQPGEPEFLKNNPDGKCFETC
jgi:hypothetical protein